MSASLPRRALDAALEATVVGSFSRVGPAVRSRLFAWDDPATDLGHRRCLVTGATSGIGRAIAAQLMSGGAEVTVTSRDLARARAAADELTDASPPGTAVGAAVDTADFDQVEALAAEVLAGGAPHVVVHNAGALSHDPSDNGEGIETTVASHLVGPYLLTRLLRPHLPDGARVIWMSSGGMYTQALDPARLGACDPDHYNGSVAYARAKRAQVELVAHLGPQWAPAVGMHAMHPGWVDTPGVADSLPGFHRTVGRLLRDADQGADTAVWLATTPTPPVAGQFWLDRRPRRRWYLPSTRTDDATRRQLVAWLDDVLADRLR